MEGRLQSRRRRTTRRYGGIRDIEEDYVSLEMTNYLFIIVGVNREYQRDIHHPGKYFNVLLLSILLINLFTASKINDKMHSYHTDLDKPSKFSYPALSQGNMGTI